MLFIQLSLAVNMKTYLLFIGIVHTGSGQMCAPLPTFARRMQILGQLDTFINFIIPYGAIAIFGSIVARKLAIFYRQRRSIVYTSANRRKSRIMDTLSGLTAYKSAIIHHPKRETQMTKLSIALCATFLLLCLPSQITRLWIMFLSFTHEHTTLDKDLLLYQNLLLQLYFTRYAVNILVYLAVSCSFRASFVSLMKCECFCAHKRQRKSRYMSAMLQMRQGTESVGIMMTQTQFLMKPLNLV